MLGSMQIKRILKRNSRVVSAHRKYLSVLRNFRLLGVMPLNVNYLALIPRYFRERKTFLGKGGVISHFFPILSEYGDSAGSASGHYFHQDLLVSQFIFQKNPTRHIDIGSRIDGFVAHVAAFRKIEIFDIRELPSSNHANIEYRQADLMLNAGYEVTDSLSCLHTIEHFGLGRYGDPLDPRGYLEGFKNLIAMLKPGGVLYISFPIGMKNEVHFNAHRVFHPKDIFSWVPNELDFLRFDYVDDNGDLHKDFDLQTSDLFITYGCGIYTFRKRLLASKVY